VLLGPGEGQQANLSDYPPRTEKFPRMLNFWFRPEVVDHITSQRAVIVFLAYCFGGGGDGHGNEVWGTRWGGCVCVCENEVGVLEKVELIDVIFFQLWMYLKGFKKCF
jgi:hypothetical protein